LKKCVQEECNNITLDTLHAVVETTKHRDDNDKTHHGLQFEHLLEYKLLIPELLHKNKNTQLTFDSRILLHTVYKLYLKTVVLCLAVTELWFFLSC